MTDITDEERALAYAFQMGSEEEAAQAIRALRGTVPPDAVAEKLRFIGYVDKFRAEYPDVAHDPEAYELAKEVDSRIAERHPDMDYWQRLSLAGDVVREQLGDHQERDYRSAVEQMRLARTTPQKAREQARAEAEQYRTRGRDPVDQEIESARSAEIAAMAQSRKGRQVEYAPPARASERR